ncbi:mitochondrial amidoxime reducing component 2-like isoform X2 [Harpegnathos saltator]|nr:mitochondrial amidoxime reducing component 2-like isoform X2 [Harpegnathos saltator]
MYLSFLSLFSTVQWNLRCKLQTLKEIITMSNEQKHLEDSSCVSMWQKVGKVQKLLMYPLLSSIPEYVTSCNLHTDGIIGYKDGTAVQNHMFVVYDRNTNIIQTDKEVMHLNIMAINFKDKNNIILKGVNIEDLVLNMVEIVEVEDTICTTSFCNKILVTVKVSDCGSVAAKWLKRFTKKMNLRLGYVQHDSWSQNTFLYHYHELRSKVDDDRNIMMSYENIPPLTLLSNESFEKMKTRLDFPMALEQFYPNIVITCPAEKPFNEINWKQIKIGDTIINNVQHIWDRSNFHLFIKSQEMPLNMKTEKMLLHCELLCSGTVKVGDNVYILKFNKYK